MHSLHTKHKFFCHEEGINGETLDFFAFQYWTFCELLCVQTEETDYKNVFVQPDHVPSKHELLLPYTVPVYNNFVALCADALEKLIP